jgi:hypothetical protein
MRACWVLTVGVIRVGYTLADPENRACAAAYVMLRTRAGAGNPAIINRRIEFLRNRGAFFRHLTQLVLSSCDFNSPVPPTPLDLVRSLGAALPEPVAIGGGGESLYLEDPSVEFCDVSPLPLQKVPIGSPSVCLTCPEGLFQVNPYCPQQLFPIRILEPLFYTVNRR